MGSCITQTARTASITHLIWSRSPGQQSRKCASGKDNEKSTAPTNRQPNAGLVVIVPPVRKNFHNIIAGMPEPKRPPQRIAIAAHPKLPEAMPVAQELAAYLSREGIYSISAQ